MKLYVWFAYKLYSSGEISVVAENLEQARQFAIEFRKNDALSYDLYPYNSWEEFIEDEADDGYQVMEDLQRIKDTMPQVFEIEIGLVRKHIGGE